MELKANNKQQQNVRIMLGHVPDIPVRADVGKR
jgi:hypothetical protein